MDFFLNRYFYSSTCTIGVLTNNISFSAFSLEPPHPSFSSSSPFCISSGLYQFISNFSPKLQYFCPLLLRVPGRSGIRIHVGNFPKDTSGCILIGFGASQNSISHSKKAFSSFIDLLSSLSSEEQNFIEISDTRDFIL